MHFVKNNISILLQEDFPQILYNKIKQDYFYSHRKEIGKPRDPEIAKVALSFLIRKHMVKTSADLEEKLERPFFRDNIQDPDTFFGLLKDFNKPPPDVDPAKIRNIEYREKLENQIEEEIMERKKEDFKEQEAEYNQKMEAKRMELAKIPTILNSKDFEEPSIQKQVFTPQIRWWETLNLRGDPFPAAEGLQKIDKSLYEDITVLTRTFKIYIDYCSNKPDQLFKNTIFYGDFGSGKTAFFDYLSEILLRNKIVAIKVAIWAKLDVDLIIQAFEKDLLSQIKIFCSKINFSPNVPSDFDTLSHIEYILKALITEKGFIGVIVIIDDLHKRPEALKAVLDFISYLQIFTSNLTRDNSINLGLYIAGIPKWRNEISTDRRLSGSLIRDEIFPEISESEGYQMLNQRLISFSKNPDKKNIMGPSFVGQIYKELKDKNLTVTFREFINKTLEKFKNNDFSILVVDPNAIPASVLNGIKTRILKDDTLRYQFNDLLERGKKWRNENLKRCIELLGQIYLDKGVVEDSNMGEEKKWQLQQLMKSGLVAPSYSNNSVKWYVTRDLYDLNKEISQEYNISMENYIASILLPKTAAKKEIKEFHYESILTPLVSKVNEAERQLLKDAIAVDRKLQQIDQKYDIQVSPQDLIQLCTRSLARLTKFYLIISNLKVTTTRDYEVLRYWTSSWNQNQALLELVNQLSDGNINDVTKANVILGLYKESFDFLAKFVKEACESNLIIRIELNDMTNDDAKKLHKIRDYWSQGKLFDAASETVRMVELKLQLTIFNIFTMLYGPLEKRLKRLDKDTRIEMSKNEVKDSKNRLSKTTNELQQVQRKHYINFMTSRTEIGKSNWEEIFKYIFDKWREEYIIEYLTNFGEFNTAVSHVKTEPITSEEQNLLLRLIVDSIYVIRSLNRSYRMLLLNSLYPTDKTYFFSFHSFKDRVSLTGIKPLKEEADHILNTMLNLSEILIHFDDRSFIENIYSIEYRNFFTILSVLLRSTDVESRKIGKKLSVLEDDSPRFQFILQKLEPGTVDNVIQS